MICVPRAVVFGELCEDILMHAPASVEVMGKKIWAKDIIHTAGGSTFYTGAALQKLGMEASICSVVGDDAAGSRILEMLESMGLNCSMIHTLFGAHTTESIVVCDGAQKNFIGCSPMLPLRLPKWEELQGADLFYIAGYTLYPELWTEEMAALCRKAKEHGIWIAMDSQSLPVEGQNLAEMSRLEQILPMVDLFFAARKDAVRLFGIDDADGCYQVMERLGFNGVLLLKRGDAGCSVVRKEEHLLVPACPVEAYDTVGSGDVFGASFCWAWLRGLGAERSAQFAAAYTALSIGEYSEQKWFPSAAETEDMLLNIKLKGDGKR